MNTLQDILPPDAIQRVRPPEPLSFFRWVDTAGFTIDGRRYTLDGSPYLRTIIEDDARVKVFRKGSQVRISSYSLGRVLWGADQFGERWIYFLPTDAETDDFVQDRVNQSIRHSDYLSARIGDIDNRGLKTVGPGIVYFRGLQTKRKAKSVPADGMVFDEVDEHKPENIAFAQDRTLESLVDRKLFLSVPSMTKEGIDALFRESDQRFWKIKCDSCGKWNCLDTDWPKNFLPIAKSSQKTWPDGTTHYRGCRYCQSRLDIAHGEWVPDNPGHRVHGYQLSRLITLTVPPDWPNAASFIMNEFRDAQGSTEKTARFVIAFRGLPFDGEGARINEEVLDGLEGDAGFYYRGNRCVMGVDQGDRLHISIYAVIPGRRLQLIYCEVTENWTRLNMLFERYGCYAAGIDGKPDRNSAKRFAAAFKGRVYLHDLGEHDILEDDEIAKRCNLQGKITEQRLRIDSRYYSGNQGTVTVPRFTTGRTESLDRTVDFVEGGYLVLPDSKRLQGNDLANYEEYRECLCSLKWKYEDTPSGRRRVYLRNNNHHGMGLNSVRTVAFEIGVEPPAPNVKPVFRKMGHA